MTTTNETNGSEGVITAASSTDHLRRLLDRPANTETRRFGGVVIGELLGIRDLGRTPIVSYPGQPTSSALAARSVVDLQATHIGRQVVLMFEDSDPDRPIIIGALRADGDSPFETRPGQVEVDADGERLIVSAKEELVLRCGEASIKLTKEGQVQGGEHAPSGKARVAGRVKECK
jgi:hypothetical protein